MDEGRPSNHQIPNHSSSLDSPTYQAHNQSLERHHSFPASIRTLKECQDEEYVDSGDQDYTSRGRRVSAEIYRYASDFAYLLRKAAIAGRY